MKLNMVSSAALLLAAITGCQSNCPVQVVRNQPPDRVNQTPLLIDEAMQERAWEPSTAYYANGDTMAWPTLFRYEPAWDQPEWQYVALDTPLFVTQVLGMPIMLVKTPIWTDVRYTGVTVEPTYSAMPAQPVTPNVVTDVPPAAPAPVELPAEPIAEPPAQPEVQP